MTYLPIILNTLFVGIGVTLLNYIPWQLGFLFLKPYGIRYCILTKKEECKRVQKKVGTNTSQLIDNNKGSGFSIGYWYVLYIDIISRGDDGDYYKITIIATESSYNSLTKDEDDKDKDLVICETSKKSIDMWESFGNPHNRWYKKRKIKIPNIIPHKNQKPLLKRITELYEEKNHVTAFIHGPPGSGKSIIGLLLAKHFSSSYCKCLRLWKPGDTLANIHSEVDPTEDKPLIILLNEIDIPLINITEGIPDHKNLDISIQDKSNWNDLFDDIQIGIYPNTIILLTSNKTVDFINQLDLSYLRESRIDFIYELKK